MIHRQKVIRLHPTAAWRWVLATEPSWDLWSSNNCKKSVTRLTWLHKLYCNWKVLNYSNSSDLVQDSEDRALDCWINTTHTAHRIVSVTAEPDAASVPCQFHERICSDNHTRQVEYFSMQLLGILLHAVWAVWLLLCLMMILLELLLHWMKASGSLDSIFRVFWVCLYLCLLFFLLASKLLLSMKLRSPLHALGQMSRFPMPFSFGCRPYLVSAFCTELELPGHSELWIPSVLSGNKEMSFELKICLWDFWTWISGGFPGILWMIPLCSKRSRKQQIAPFCPLGRWLGIFKFLSVQSFLNSSYFIAQKTLDSLAFAALASAAASSSLLLVGKICPVTCQCHKVFLESDMAASGRVRWWISCLGSHAKFTLLPGRCHCMHEFW